MTDEFSNFKSAIEWPTDREPEEPPTGELRHITGGLLGAIEHAAASFELAGVTESPIETIFGAELRVAFERTYGDDFAVEGGSGRQDASIILKPQFVIGRFRYDFAILVKGRPVLLVECDGKYFHSSPDQIENDLKKNEAASGVGLVLLRFSGSEIHRDLNRCVQEAVATFHSETWKRGWP